MKATTTKEKLADAVKAVGGLCAKDAMSAFSNMRLDASGRLSVTATSGDIQVEMIMLDCDIEEPGTVTVLGAAFASHVGALPDGDVEIESTNHRLSIKADGAKATFNAGEASEFPVMAAAGKDEAESLTFDIGAVLLREMLRKVKFAVSTAGTRRNIEGVNIDLKGGTLGMTATDGRRLAHVEKEVDEAGAGARHPEKKANITLPAKAVEKLYALLGRMEGGSVSIALGRSSARFIGDDWALMARVFEDKYPDWSKVVPEKPKHRVELKREAFLAALGWAALSNDEACGVKITLVNGRALFESRNAWTKARSETSECRMDEGVKGEFNVNPRLMRDALEAIDEDDFALEFDEGNGMAIKLTCSLPWVAVVMPYRKEG